MVTTKEFGTTADGKTITEYCLTNANKMTVSIINYGAIITSITVPGKNDQPDEITLGFNNLSSYETENVPYFGATVGRVAGRIHGAKFTANNRVYHLSKNAGNDQLHGGIPGFQRVTWNAESYVDEGCCGLVLNYLSLEGEAGYPGNLGVIVSYHLTDDNELFIDYSAETDHITPVNLTNHTYWNLNPTSGNIFNHHLEIGADEVLELDDNLMPTGKIISVKGTAFDFTEPTSMGKHLKEIRNGYGHDQCYLLCRKPGDLNLAATVIEPNTGRKLECYTTQTGLQFYTGNNLAGEVGREGVAYQPYDGFCLEAQSWPDAVNHPDFPNIYLKPGKEYRHTTCYQLYF